jgi:hypothetical protein
MSLPPWAGGVDPAREAIVLTLTTFDESAREEMMTGPSIIPRTMPGSRGEHDLQERYGTRARAEAF